MDGRRNYNRGRGGSGSGRGDYSGGRGRGGNHPEQNQNQQYGQHQGGGRAGRGARGWNGRGGSVQMSGDSVPPRNQRFLPVLGEGRVYRPTQGVVTARPESGESSRGVRGARSSGGRGARDGPLTTRPWGPAPSRVSGGRSQKSPELLPGGGDGVLVTALRLVCLFFEYCFTVCLFRPVLRWMRGFIARMYPELQDVMFFVSEHRAHSANR